MTNEDYKKQFEERFYNQLIDDYASEHLYDAVWSFVTQALDEVREEAVRDGFMDFLKWLYVEEGTPDEYDYDSLEGYVNAYLSKKGSK